MFAYIPARSGSKRILNKNIKLFKGKPIILYVIENLKKLNFIDEIYVSTDSIKIQKKVKKYARALPSVDTHAGLQIIKGILTHKFEGRHASITLEGGNGSQGKRDARLANADEFDSTRVAVARPLRQRHRQAVRGRVRQRPAVRRSPDSG